MAEQLENRAKREIEHGKWLVSTNPEAVWGWGTPAGRARAARRAELIAKGARLGPGVGALEIGCGTGLFTEMFARTGARITAVDISPELIAMAEARGLPAERVKFITKPFEDCAGEGPFDAVIGSSILHHLALKAALENIFDLLKPGGRMSFAEPNMLNPQVFLERKLRFLFKYVSPDETAFTRRGLRRELERSGFEKVSITPFDWLHPRLPGPLVKTASSIGKMLEAAPLLREFSGSLFICASRPERRSAAEKT